ncbi:uncharacterized protein LOC122643303 [Telopea speciosissima]|uniref:uncharacterized protein LOC122643303 n=1 Tax=Telopea speciosissima TaxID=54955 RepID=UPI001CC614FB|nr:uncharacterized protein LOC122643303 [Telopea speciosissima]
MRKAYDRLEWNFVEDRLEWNFVEDMLLKLGFDRLWVDRVMSCIKTVTYNLLINGCITGNIIPTRGIRQRDPISPAIFILCSQALTAVIKRAKAAGNLHGVRVDIWKDNWIPSLPNYKVQSQRPVDCGLTFVTDLIDPTSRTWKTSLLQRLFQLAEVNAILKISLSFFAEEDIQVWGASKDGRFFMKSAYWLLAKKEEEDQRSRAATSKVRNWEMIPEMVWRRIWKIDTLPKIKAFIWRTCNEGLPTGSGLHARHIPIDPVCPRRGFEKEIGDHLLLDCPCARAVWHGSSLHYSPPTDVTPTIVGWLGSWDVVFRHDKRLVHEALSKSQVADRDSPPHVWTVPPTSITKINCDATLPQDNAKGGLGLVLRDHAGNQRKFVSIPMCFNSALQGELLAVCAALRLALELGLTQVQVESDCREVVNYILDHSYTTPIDSAVVLGDIWKLSASFSSISFHYISRAINGVADALAKKALSLVCLTD